MTTVGAYTMTKTARGYVLRDKTGAVLGPFATAREANAKAVGLTAAAYLSK